MAHGLEHTLDEIWRLAVLLEMRGRAPRARLVPPPFIEREVSRIAPDSLSEYQELFVGPGDHRIGRAYPISFRHEARDLTCAPAEDRVFAPRRRFSRAIQVGQVGRGGEPSNGTCISSTEAKLE